MYSVPLSREQNKWNNYKELFPCNNNFGFQSNEQNIYRGYFLGKNVINLQPNEQIYLPNAFPMAIVSTREIKGTIAKPGPIFCVEQMNNKRTKLVDRSSCVSEIG